MIRIREKFYPQVASRRYLARARPRGTFPNTRNR